MSQSLENTSANRDTAGDSRSNTSPLSSNLQQHPSPKHTLYSSTEHTPGCTGRTPQSSSECTPHSVEAITPHFGDKTPQSGDAGLTPHCYGTEDTASSYDLTPSPYRTSDDPVEESCRNPEPPKELAELIDADNIGGTVFSKHWLFTTLMKLLQVVEDADIKDEKEGTDSTAGQQYIDLDETLQDNLCKLWDMSMNPEVVMFLMEFKAIDLLCGVIAKSRAPRATEICVGILGNMACNAAVCHEINRNKHLFELLLLLLETPDAPTLIETMRLLLVSVSATEHTTCLRCIKDMPHVYTSILFILQSSTNCNLLKNTAQLVDKIMDIDDTLCSLWGTADLVLSVMEALKQTGTSDICLLETFIHILHLVSTSETGVQALVSYAGEVSVLMLRHLVHVCTDDIVAVTGRENIIASTLSVLSVVFTSWPEHQSVLVSDFQLVRCVSKIVETVYPRLKTRPVVPLTPRRRTMSRIDSPTQDSDSSQSSEQHDTLEQPQDTDWDHKLPVPVDSAVAVQASKVPADASKVPADVADASKVPADVADASKVPAEAADANDAESDEEYSMKRTEMLFEVLQNFLIDLLPLLDSLPTADGEELNKTPGEGQVEGQGKGETSRSLLYLNSLCERRRLECLIHSLASVSHKHLVNKLLNIAQRFKLHRLSRIVSQTLPSHNTSR